MRVDHRRAHVAVSEQLLDGANIITVLEQVCGEAVAEGVATGWLCNPCPSDG
jgi:hypothetical protein